MKQFYIEIWINWHRFLFKSEAGTGKIEIFPLSTLFNLTEWIEFFSIPLKSPFVPAWFFPLMVKMDEIHGAVQDFTNIKWYSFVR